MKWRTVLNYIVLVIGTIITIFMGIMLFQSNEQRKPQNAEIIQEKKEPYIEQEEIGQIHYHTVTKFKVTHGGVKITYLLICNDKLDGRFEIIRLDK